jgi:hypothetical protein
LGSVNVWKFLDHLSKYQLLKTDDLHGVRFAAGCQTSEISVNSKLLWCCVFANVNNV